MEKMFVLLNEIDLSFVELSSIDNSLKNSDIDLGKLIEEVRVGNFAGSSDYNSLVEELDVSNDTQADKDKNSA